MPNRSPIVVPKDFDWRLYNILRRLANQSQSAQNAVAAVVRGEVPDGSGDPLVDLAGVFLLQGRNGGQDAHGGTSPSESLILSSTTNPTRGFIYLGDAKTSAYDETHDRIGVGQPLPTARLHLKVPVPVNQFSRPSSQLGNSGASIWSGEDASTTNLHTKLNETSPNDATYVKHLRNLGTLTLGLSTVTNPGVTTGHILRFRCRVPVDVPFNATDHLQVGMSNGAANWFTTNVPATGDMAGSFTTYTFTLSSAEAAAISSYSTMQIGFIYYTGFDSGSEVDVSWIEFEVPSLGSGTAETLQKWEAGSSLDQLDYGNNGAAAVDLQLSGNTNLFVSVGDATSGLRFYTASNAAFIEVGKTDQTNTVLNICGNRASKATAVRIAATGTIISNDVPASMVTPAGILHIKNASGTSVLNLVLQPVSGQTVPVLRVVDSTGATDLGGLTATGAYYLIVGAAAGMLLTSNVSGVGSWQLLPDHDHSGTAGSGGGVLNPSVGGLTLRASASGSEQLCNIIDTDTGHAGALLLPITPIGNSCGWILPTPPTAATVTLVASSTEATLFLNLLSHARCNTSTSGFLLFDNTGTGKALRFILSTAATGNHTITINSTAARNYNFPDATGVVNITVAANRRQTISTTEVSPTTIYSVGVAGFYRIEVTTLCTTAGSASSNGEVTLNWNDGTARSHALFKDFSHNLDELNELESEDPVIFCAAGTTITNQVTTISGGGSPVFDLITVVTYVHA